MIEQASDLQSPASSTQLPCSIELTRRSDIDGLRAVAVAAVVVFHTFPNYLTGGFIGVDIFFVISGYLISSIIYNGLETDSFSFTTFYARRIRRIFPSLIVILVACYTAGWYTLLATEYERLGIHIAAGAGFVSNFLLNEESGYFDEASDKKALLHLWSLAIEEQFYIVWPVLLYILWKKRVSILNISIVLTLSSFILNVVRVKTHKTETFYWPTSRVWELLVGACLALALKSMKDRFQHNKDQCDAVLIRSMYKEPSTSKDGFFWNLVSIAGTLLIAFPVCLLTEKSVFPGWWAICPTFGTAFLILSGPTAWINKNILSSRLLVGIGLISYPLYLWHWPLLVFTRIIVGPSTSDNTHVVIIIISVVLAFLTYILIDKPLRFGSCVKVRIVFICVPLMMIGVLGYYTYSAEGLPSRFPIGIQSLINVKFDRTLYRLKKCHLDPYSDESKFGSCTHNVKRPASTAVLVWGDSHAAHLFPGIRAAKSNLRITQLTASRCPPIKDFRESVRPLCQRLNDYVLKRISNEKPNTVVLAAHWNIYKQWNNITESIMYLKNASIKNIYLIGPLPIWRETLPKILYNYYSRDPFHRVPKRISFGWNTGTAKLDAAMRAFAAEIKINYISLYELLCNSEGCLTRSGEDLGTVMVWDKSHLTVAGSVFIVSHLPRAILYSK